MSHDHNLSIMRQYLIVILLILTGCVHGFAQDNLRIGIKMNGSYRNNPNASETILIGDNKLKRIGVTLYHSLSVSDDPAFPEEVEPLLLVDVKSAIDREVVYRSGKLYYGFYALPSIKKDGKNINRYIFYLNQFPVKGKQVIMIYVEGTASPQQIKDKLLKQ